MKKISIVRDNTTLNQRLNDLMKKNKLTINALSKLSGISIGAIQNISSSPACNPTLEKIESLATALQVPISYLIGETNETSITTHEIPIISWSDIKNIHSHHFHFLKKITNKQAKICGHLSNKAFSLKMQGKAMLPIFNENSLLIFDPEKEKYDGCYALFYINENDSYIFRELIIDGTNHYYKALNQNFEGGLKKLYKHDAIIAILTKVQHSY